MKLIKCETCGASSFTDNKCDYCGNEYETTNDKEVTKIDFQETPEGKTLLKIMIWTLISIIWFAICIFIPPLFIITICGLIIWICRKIHKKINKNI